MAAIPPTNPHHVAAVYGAEVAGRIAAQQRPPSQDPTRPAAPASSVDDASDETAARRERLARLVAAVVPGGIDFDGRAPAPSAPDGALPFYPHPAQRHAAATQIHAHMGRNLDVEG